jgi:predicted DNA-binding transcriptional regulator AlpA
MTTDTPTTKRRKAETPALRLEPYMLSPEQAAAFLAAIGKTSLDRLVAAGEITPRRITANRVGYLRRELEAWAESLPAVRPGLPKPRAEQPGG